MTDETPDGDGAPPPEVNAGAATKPGVGITIAKNYLWLLTDSIAGMLTAFYCSILVARGLGPDRMGEYNYLLYFAAVLKMFTEVAVPVTLRKFAAELMGREDYSALKTLVRAALRLEVKLAALGLVVGLTLAYLIFRPDQRALGMLAVVTIVPGILLSVPAGALWATENLSYNVVASVAAMAVNAAGVTASVFLGWGLMGLVASMLGSRTIDCALRFLLYRWRYSGLPGTARDHVEPDLRRRMISFAAMQLVLILLYALLFDRMEVFFLKALAPSREIAFFSISFTLAQYLLIIPQTLSGSASVSMMVRQGRSSNESARIAVTATWFAILFATPILFGVSALSDPLMHLIYGVRYLPAVPVLGVLCLFSLALAASQSAQWLLVSAERQMFYMVVLVGAGLFDVLGNLLLIPSFGALGAAYAKGSSQLLAAAAFLAYMVWRFKVTLPFGRIARLLLAATAMYAVVRLLGEVLASLPAVVAGIPVGAGIFFLLVRWLRCLDAADRDRLRQLTRMMPSRARPLYLGLLHFLVP